MPASRCRSAALLCCAALIFGATPLVGCDPAWLPMARPEGISIFVALALADTLLDGAMALGKARLRAGFGERVDSAIGETRGGQRVRLLRWNEAGRRPGRGGGLGAWGFGPGWRPDG